ncbi:hypothetical protein ABIA35_003257 [Catenulispora sp. MAP12-49]|uniref:hypothetical protein n=1 Tax=unclassified Catenulispora TaxID=414885 RepID=UPI003518C7BC
MSLAAARNYQGATVAYDLVAGNHAEENIIYSLAPDEIIAFGGTSLSPCEDLCYPKMMIDGMKFGGGFGGRADKSPYSYFWLEDFDEAVSKQ